MYLRPLSLTTYELEPILEKKSIVFSNCCAGVNALLPDVATWFPYHGETKAIQSFLVFATAATAPALTSVSASFPIEPPIRTKSKSVSSVSWNNVYAAEISPALYA